MPDIGPQIEWLKPPAAHSTDTLNSVLREVWNSQALHNQLFGSWLDFKNQSPEDRAWEEAIASIERRRAADKEWPWPARPSDYFSPSPVGA